VVLDAARAEMFWEDSVTCDVKDVKVYGDCASVYGSVVYEDLGMRWRKVFHGTVIRKDGRLAWDRWMECADPLLANRYAGWTSDNPEAGAEYVSMAWNIINGEFSAARAQTPKILALDPGMATAHLGTAWGAWVDGDDEAAQAAMAAAVEALDDEGEAQQLMVRALATQDADEALHLLEKALVIAPDDPLLAVNYTVVLGLRKEDPAGAARFLRRALRRWPNVGGLHNMMGYMLMAQEDVDGAGRHFKMYMRLQPNTANAYDSMGDYLQATGKTEEAKAMYQKTLELDPEFKAAKRKLDAMP
jgi:tetratricopeptide (TPR) repeat protein